MHVPEHFRTTGIVDQASYRRTVKSFQKKGPGRNLYRIMDLHKRFLIFLSLAGRL